MINKKILMRILVILPVIGIVFAGCSDDNVGINYKKLPQVSSVTVTKTTNNRYYIVSWDAVKGDGNKYTVYLKKDGKKSFSSLGNGQNFYKYDPATGDQINNDNLDKWAYRVSRLEAPTAGPYFFGVRTGEDPSFNNTIDSDIKWAAGITVTAVQVSAVSIKITTDGKYLIASWDAVAGASGYDGRFLLYQENSVAWGSTTPQNTYTYSEADGAQSTNTDSSKWSCRYDISNSYYSSYNEFGFRVTPVVSSTDISVLVIDTISPTISR